MKRNSLIVLALVSTVALAACSENATGPTEVATFNQIQAIEADVGLNRRAPAPGDETIAEIAEANGFNLLLDAITYIAEMNPESPLVAGLLDKDQYTVFAPTDQAFINLVEAVTPLLDPDVLADDGPFAAIDDLLGAGTIEAVVSYHVTEGRRAANSVVPHNRFRILDTLLEGGTLQVSPEAIITAVGSTANITAANISASNGIIHVIDAVLLPIDLGL
jgi:uncharacterized surface protein with fasciclin (FAS1) repeats